jgi:hypothetical protein
MGNTGEDYSLRYSSTISFRVKSLSSISSSSSWMISHLFFSTNNGLRLIKIIQIQNVNSVSMM